MNYVKNGFIKVQKVFKKLQMLVNLIAKGTKMVQNWSIIDQNKLQIAKDWSQIDQTWFTI